MDFFIRLAMSIFIILWLSDYLDGVIKPNVKSDIVSTLTSSSQIEISDIIRMTKQTFFQIFDGIYSTSGKNFFQWNWLICSYLFILLVSLVFQLLHLPLLPLEKLLLLSFIFPTVFVISEWILFYWSKIHNKRKKYLYEFLGGLFLLVLFHYLDNILLWFFPTATYKAIDTVLIISVIVFISGKLSQSYVFSNLNKKYMLRISPIITVFISMNTMLYMTLFFHSDIFDFFMVYKV